MRIELEIQSVQNQVYVVDERIQHGFFSEYPYLVREVDSNRPGFR